MSAFLILMLTMAPVKAAATESAVTQVVSLLQEMLEKSKSDGNADREVYSKFKCYCDTNTEEKTEAIATAATDIERMEAELADRRGQNERLSQEIAHMKTAMEANTDAQSEATTLRNEENTSFNSEESDLETGISQLDRAIEILAAVGADQTVSTSADNEQFMAADATAAAKAGFLVKKASIKTLTSDMKEALRAASVFLDNDQRKVLTGFVQQSAPGNYNAQSGEIVGVLKEMSDTFKANLKNARAAEAKALDEHNGFMEVKATEHGTTLESSDAKKVVLGNNAAQIATTSSELSTMETQKGNDEDFLSALTDRCNTKKKEYDHRNMLRANEEAAIAQAIAILNSDANFNTFGSVAATSTGSTSFVQLSHNSHQSTRRSISHRLLEKARSIHSLKLTRVAAALRANNPFTEVVKMITDMVTLIDKEEADDVAKKDWCETEQTNNNGSHDNKVSEIMTLETNINTDVESLCFSQQF